jgi:hypothetical protein
LKKSKYKNIETPRFKAGKIKRIISFLKKTVIKEEREKVAEKNKNSY